MKVLWRHKNRMSNKPSMEELLKQKINNQGSNNESSKQSNTENEKSKRHTRQGENNTSEKKKSYKDLCHIRKEEQET